MRGQAFDTFKLMIAAVIAVAILGILLGILQQIQGPTGDPITTTRDLMQKALSNPGTELPSAQKLSFTKGTVFRNTAFRSLFGNVNTPTIYFTCDSTLVDNGLCIYTDSNLEYSLNILTIDGDFESNIKVCCSAADYETCYVNIGTGNVHNGCK